MLESLEGKRGPAPPQTSLSLPVSACSAVPTLINNVETLLLGARPAGEGRILVEWFFGRNGRTGQRQLLRLRGGSKIPA